MTPATRLEAHDLAATRGSARLFQDVTFRLDAGHVLLVRGPNGAGKTTLLRVLAGLTHPAAGTVRLDGEALRPFDPRLRGALAFVGHAPAVKDELTAEENLATLLALAGEPAAPRVVMDALATAGLERQRGLPARALSQGQRRRIGLARLSALRRRLWILDEPATALDADGCAWLGELIARHAASGGVAVAATHQPLSLPNTQCATLSLG